MPTQISTSSCSPFLSSSKTLHPVIKLQFTDSKMETCSIRQAPYLSQTFCKEPIKVRPLSKDEIVEKNCCIDYYFSVTRMVYNR